MAKRSDERKILISMSSETLDRLQIAAIDLKKDVPRRRVMERGPMIAYLCRWFLELDRETKLRVILAGKALDEGGAWNGAENLTRKIGEETREIDRRASEGKPGRESREPRKTPRSPAKIKTLGVRGLGLAKRKAKRRSNGE